MAPPPRHLRAGLLSLFLLLPFSRSQPGCPPEYSSGDDSFSLQRYGEDRAGCTALCNAGGYACTLDSGGCNAIPCTSGCHVAWFSDDVASCKATCNEGNAASCEWTWHHAEVSEAERGLGVWGGFEIDINDWFLLSSPRPYSTPPPLGFRPGLVSNLAARRGDRQVHGV